jgi:asparaginyl-tRNA synthetase
VIASATSFFGQLGFVQTHPPIITSSDCEGGGEVFEIGTEPVQQAATSGKAGHVADASYFFRNTKYLTVSSQLHLEALAQSVGNVWTLSPTFRAEKSDTPRHLSEFYMLEAEICFVEELDGIMDVVEALIRDIGRHVKDSRLGLELLSSAGAHQGPNRHEGISRDQLEARWTALVDQSWPRITYHEAVKTLQSAVSRGEASFDFGPTVGAGLQAEHEKYLAAVVGSGSPVFVTDYPRDIKAFYMAPTLPEAAADRPTVACFDLLVPEICEIVGGSMREHRLQDLLANMARHGLMKPNIPAKENTPGSASASSEVVQTSPSSSGAPRNLQWYVDLRRYGSVPHGGFGIGFDRLLCYLAGFSSIRDVVAFPRWYGRCDC